jgi:hypothetical protein
MSYDISLIFIFSYLDDRALAFIKVITPHLNGISITFLMRMESLGAQKRGFINQLLKIFREEKSPNTPISIFTMLGNIQFLQDMDNETRKIQLWVKADMAIQVLMKWLATPRPDGKQRVIWLFFFGNGNDQLAMGMVDAIKQV